MKAGGAGVPTMMAALFGTPDAGQLHQKWSSPGSCTWRTVCLPRWFPAWVVMIIGLSLIPGRTDLPRRRLRGDG
ncbi:hypothetical protein MJ588_27800 [Klebsiella pneumoniae]|nr:hypothetical protein MJ588_27800 [Klebsiella pneumoniae]